MDRVLPLLEEIGKALEYEHGDTHWKEETLSDDYVVNTSCPEEECDICKLLSRYHALRQPEGGQK